MTSRRSRKRKAIRWWRWEAATYRNREATATAAWSKWFFPAGHVEKGLLPPDRRRQRGRSFWF
jgi:hypothetical protein